AYRDTDRPRRDLLSRRGVPPAVPGEAQPLHLQDWLIVSDDTASNANVLARAFDFVRTERLALHRPIAGDALAFFQLDGNPAANRFNPDGPAPDLAASEARLNEWLRQWQIDGYGYWALAVPPDSAVVGFGGVRRINWRDRTVLNLYYKLQPAIWRHGCATEL